MPIDELPSPVIIDVTEPSSAPPAASPRPAASPPPAEDPPPPERSGIEKLWAFVRKYLIAPLPVLLLVVGAAVLVVMGAKNVQIGGLLGKLLGKRVPQKAIGVANSIPPERVRPDGTLIPIGEADSVGMIQARVVPIEKPGMFSDPRTVKLTPPGTDEPIEVAVPDGVEAKDIAQVVVVKSKVTGVVVKNDSAVKGEDVDDLLARYAK